MNPLSNTQVARTAFADAHRVDEQHQKGAEESNITREGRASANSRLNVHLATVAKVAVTVKQALQRAALKRKQKTPKKESLSSIAKKLIEEMAADGDKEDLGDERRDPMELFAEYQAAHDLISGKLKLENPEEQKELEEMLNKLPDDKKQSMLKQLDAGKSRIKEKGGKEFEENLEAAKIMQEVFDHLKAKGMVSSEDMEKLRPLFTKKSEEDGIQAFSVHKMAAVFAICFQGNFASAVENMQKVVSGPMSQRDFNNKDAARKAPRLYLSMDDTRAFLQMKGVFHIAQELWNDLTKAMHKPPSLDAGKLTEQMLQVTQKKPQKIQTLLENLKLTSTQGEVYKAIHTAIEKLNPYLWPAGSESQKYDLLRMLKDEFRETQSGTPSHEKKVDSREAELRTQATLVKAH